MIGSLLLGAVVGTVIVLLWRFASEKKWTGFWIVIMVTLCVLWVAGTLTFFNWIASIAATA